MSRLATLMMLLAWLLYGAMPATAMPILPAGGMQHIMMTDMAGDGMPDAPMAVDMSSAAASGHDHGAMPQSGSKGGKICVAAFCAACLTLLPDLDFAAGRDVPRSSYHTVLHKALVAGIPAPATPPPRS